MTVDSTTSSGNQLCPNCGMRIAALVRPGGNLHTVRERLGRPTQICHIGNSDTSNIAGYRVVHA